MVDNFDAAVEGRIGLAELDHGRLEPASKQIATRKAVIVIVKKNVVLACQRYLDSTMGGYDGWLDRNDLVIERRSCGGGAHFRRDILWPSSATSIIFSGSHSHRDVRENENAKCGSGSIIAYYICYSTKTR